jgi:hypothetical protein
MSASDLASVRKGSRSADRLRNQLSDRTHVHSMRNSSQSADEAVALREAFIASKLDEARGHLAGGDRGAALLAFGEGIHAIMDATSPAHVDGGGKPQVWRLRDTRSHIKAESQSPTAAQSAESTGRIRDAHASVFGKP